MAEQQTYLMIDEAGLVQNLCVWDGETPYSQPEGWTLVELAAGEYYEFGQPRGIDPPPPPPPPPESFDVRREIADLMARLEKLQRELR